MKATLVCTRHIEQHSVELHSSLNKILYLNLQAISMSVIYLFTFVCTVSFVQLLLHRIAVNPVTIARNMTLQSYSMYICSDINALCSLR